MKGLQGERLRQAFKYLDSDGDGVIKPEQFKQIILVRMTEYHMNNGVLMLYSRKLRVTNCQMRSSKDFQRSAH